MKLNGRHSHISMNIFRILVLGKQSYGLSVLSSRSRYFRRSLYVHDSEATTPMHNLSVDAELPSEGMTLDIWKGKRQARSQQATSRR